MKDLSWVNIFPEWNDGFTGLLKANGVSRPQKKKLKLINPSYSQKVSFTGWFGSGAFNMKIITTQLKSNKNYFLFTVPEMPVMKNSEQVIGGIKNFEVYKVPKSYQGT